MALDVLGTALAEACDIDAACAAVVDHLASDAEYKPSMYLERGGRLRCIAARTYLQVFDGMPLSAGMIGRTFASGTAALVPDVTVNEHYLEISPGVRSEICVPVVGGDRVVGVISVESLSTHDLDHLARVEDCAKALGRRLDDFGGGLRETPPQRLLRHATRLTDTKSRRRLEREILEAATDVAGMDSAALLGLSGNGAVEVIDAIGPIDLAAVPQEALDTVVRFVEGGTSCFTVGESGGQDFSGLALLRDHGACALAMLELSHAPARVLLVADSVPHEIATETIELLELLSFHAASALRVADLVRDLRVEAATDPLTGLGHHRSFHARLHASAGDGPQAVIVVDLDGFKRINDSQGHAAGDRLLREVAAVLQAVVREGDDAFRIGGDEFAVLAHAADREQALEIGARIVDEVHRRTAITASIGICLAESSEPLDEALLRADHALYSAKAQGRDRAVLADA
jgi:diguanylate cyclase (GGDEF)-like protein